MSIGVKPARPCTTDTLLDRNAESRILHPEWCEDSALKDITKRCVFDPSHEEAQQVGRMTIVESSSGLIDQRQLGKSANPFVWSELIVDSAPERLGIGFSDGPAMEFGVGKPGTVGQQL